MIAPNKTIFTCISDRSDDGKVFGHLWDENCTVNNVTWAITSSVRVIFLFPQYHD